MGMCLPCLLMIDPPKHILIPGVNRANFLERTSSDGWMSKSLAVALRTFPGVLVLRSPFGQGDWDALGGTCGSGHRINLF